MIKPWPPVRWPIREMPAWRTRQMLPNPFFIQRVNNWDTGASLHALFAGLSTGMEGA
jgi:hypothetical protein